MIIHQHIKATREGLLGKKTSSGYTIDTHVPFVALPCGAALYRVVKVRNEANQKMCAAIVLDVGPWNISDSKYVLEDQRPLAENGIKTEFEDGKPGKQIFDSHINKAGIDLSEFVWQSLGMTDNGLVSWWFIDEPWIIGSATVVPILT